MNQLSKISSAKIQHFSAVCKFFVEKVISPTSVVGLLMEIGILFSCQTSWGLVIDLFSKKETKTFGGFGDSSYLCSRILSYF